MIWRLAALFGIVIVAAGAVGFALGWIELMRLHFGPGEEDEDA